MIRFVFDTNTIVSALLFGSSVPRQAFDRALDSGTILISDSLVMELSPIHREVPRQEGWNTVEPEFRPEVRDASPESSRLATDTPSAAILLTERKFFFYSNRSASYCSQIRANAETHLSTQSLIRPTTIFSIAGIRRPLARRGLREQDHLAGDLAGCDGRERVDCGLQGEAGGDAWVR